MPNQPPELKISSTAENDAEEAELIKLHAQWEEHMKDLSPRRRYTRVAVLLLFWDRAGDNAEASYLDTSEEIRDLKAVLENRYHFTVRKQSLNPITEKKKSPQKLLQKCLADFVDEEDEKDSLLIVYYAGHGNPGSGGELMLTGGNHLGDKIIDGVAWSQTESLIHTAEEADVLLIFDCCFAGKLCGTLNKRAAFDTRIFEFLGATVSNGLARLPGKESFTRALICALEELADEEDGFTTSKLYNKILDSKDFPRHEQTPVLTERRGHCLKRLVLAPLDPILDANRPSTPAVGAERPRFAVMEPTLSPNAAESSRGQQEKDTYHYSLMLQLCFPTLLNNKELEDMCSGLKQLTRTGELKAKQIIWRGMHRKGSSPYEIPHSAHAAGHAWLSRIDRKRRKSFREGARQEESPAPQQHPTPESEKAMEQDSPPESASEGRIDDERPTQTKRRKDNTTSWSRGGI